ncbi:MAG: sodium:solute symporter [Flavobacteriales bacterium]|nr:sodium:solute symporter [Flavobacteriales bacterium]
MAPALILSIIAAYFVLLFAIGHFTSKGADNDSFFLGNRNSPWYVVAFGMIGASLSGVTFISIPGWVGASGFSYMQVVLGYLVGYAVIALILMPLYYRLNLTSIYGYLEQRFGRVSYRTGASFFLLSRTIGSAFRLYLVANVLQLAVFDAMGVPFVATVIGTILFIWGYTNKGGIRTIIWTDTLQTMFMLVAVVLTVVMIGQAMGWTLPQAIGHISDSSYSKVFFFDDINSRFYFWKQFLSGIFIAIVMTGLDQDMMQKNLSCRNIREAQINMGTFSFVLVFVNLAFLGLGALLYIYAEHIGMAIPARTDDLYPLIATGGHLPVAVGVIFILGLIAAAYSSADSALTALTTSVCVDLLDIRKRPQQVQQTVRKRVHILVSAVMVLVIVIFRAVNDDSVISAVFTAAGYTYGPLLGLYAFGMMTRWQVRDRWVPVVCVLSPIICYVLNLHSEELMNGYRFGFELLIVNGLLTFMGLVLLRDGKKTNPVLG